MVQKHTFPQNGDYDDAENFAQLVGHEILADYVVEGLGFTVDYTVPEVTIGNGVCTVSKASVTGAQSGKSILSATYTIQLPQTTVSLTDGDVNHIYVEPDVGTNNNGSLVAYTNESNAGADALKVGTVDTANDTATETNRKPAINDIAIQSLLELGDNVPLSIGEMEIEYEPGGNRLSINLPDGTDGIDIDDQGNLILNGHTLKNATVPTAQDADQVDGKDYSDIQSWVNNNADVPNADYADTAGSGEAGFDLKGDLVAADGETIFDESAGAILLSILEHDSVTVAGKKIQLGGSATISIGDLSDVNASGEGHGNGLNADKVDGSDVYVQNSTPSDAEVSAGDIWIDTS